MAKERTVGCDNCRTARYAHHTVYENARVGKIEGFLDELDASLKRSGGKKVFILGVIDWEHEVCYPCTRISFRVVGAGRIRIERAGREDMGDV